MKKIFLLAIVSFVLTSCNNDENYVATPASAQITATIGASTDTRASDSDWTPGDEIGISSTVGSMAGPYTNIKYTTGGDGKFTGEIKLYFYSPMTLTAYYPFTGPEKELPGENGVIEAETTSEYQKDDKQPRIDFLWDTKTGEGKKDFSSTNPNVNFVFSHKMSKVTFTFLDSEAVYNGDLLIADPVDVRNMINYTLKGLKLRGTFNTRTGVCNVKEGVEDLSIDVEDVKHNEAIPPIILFPQTLSGGSAELNIYTDEFHSAADLQHYKCSLSFSNGEIKPGYHYQYTIKVTKIGLIVGEMTVKPWEEEDRFMTATIDGENAFK